MPGLIVWKNQHFNRLRKDMDRMFDRMWGEFAFTPAPPVMKGLPFVDLAEDENNLIIRVELPGMNPDEFEIVLDEDKLALRGETRQETLKGEANYHRVERRYGSFSRTIQLPCRVKQNDVKATYKKGILKIVMPKCPPEPAKRVKVSLK
jgi:HSP20 family protein